MIDSTLEFPAQALRTVVAAFLALPEGLRPTHHCVGEDDVGEPIHDRARQIETLAKRTSGFFLKGPRVTYDISLAGIKPIICNCFLEVEASLAKQFLMRMAAAQPIFGFACSRDERYQRNRVITRLDAKTTVESWVGRDTQKYVPGFYWLTLLPDALAKQHGVPLLEVGKVAQEHLELEGGQHLFRFYERPEDWQMKSDMTELCASLPGIFDVEKIKPQLSAAKNFLELDSMLRVWK